MTTAGVANIANLKCCCGLCNSCPSGQDLPTSFSIALSVAPDSSPSFPSFARFNTTNTVTYNASHTGRFGTAYAGWFYTSGIDDGAHDYTEISVKCSGPGSLTIQAYRFLVSPPSGDSLDWEIVGTGASPTNPGNSCSPVYIHEGSPVFFLSGNGSSGSYGSVRFANSITITP